MSGTLMKEGSISSSSYLKNGCIGFQNAPPLTNPSAQISSSGIPINSTSLYQNENLPGDVTSSPAMGSHSFEMTSLVNQNIRGSDQGSWVDGGNELILLPSYGNQLTSLRANNVAASASASASSWMDRAMEGNNQWNGGGRLGTITNDNAVQGLSLSLSSLPPNQLQVAQFEEKFGSQSSPSRNGISIGSGLNPDDVGYHCSYSSSSIGNKGIVPTSTDARRLTGPLGPFTGYATILKSSKFLKPAQQLLDEFCNVHGPKLTKTNETSEKGSIDLSAENGNSGPSAASFHSSTETCQTYRPDFHRKKAKLLFMQEEVCRRYKQYHQQMQMVISSFESVAGLSAATPYTSLALKAVLKHFRCLKNAISDQLRLTSKALGEDFISAGSSKGETVPRLRLIDQGFQKQKTGESLSFLDQHQQHIWRPQRGLPERAVSVLRAWLFEHFLHPYPTDTDKHMLATQTGLSRNQVSNWFINARVRVWKPMVEEIHMLETKRSTGMDLNSVKNDGTASSERGRGEMPAEDQPNKLVTDSISDKQSDCSTAGPSYEHRQNLEQWHQEKKRSRMDQYQVPSSIDGSLMGFVPYHSGFEMGGLGTVSLTLGLRHSEEGMQAQQQQPLRGHFGGQMVHDFGG